MKPLYFLLLSLLSVTVYADVTYYCPNTSQYINVGDRIEVVETSCGKPTYAEQKIEKKEDSVAVKQWIYNINTFQTGPLMFTIRDGAVAGIRVGGVEVQSTDLCGGRGIRIGDLEGTVTSACGANRLENKGDVLEDKGAKQVTVWIYDYGDYQPQAKLEFEDGVLTNIATGKFK